MNSKLNIDVTDAEEVAEPTMKQLMAADLKRTAKVSFRSSLLQDGNSAALTTKEVDQGFLQGLFTAVLAADVGKLGKDPGRRHPLRKRRAGLPELIS